jgi:hypothetical protein
VPLPAKESIMTTTVMPRSHRRNSTGRRWLARGRTVLCLLVLATTASAQAPRASEPMPGDYRIESGRVDRGTYLGWRLFHTACYGCHGVGARGTDLAPSLVDRVRDLSPRAFATKVLTSYRLVQPADESDTTDRNAALEALIEQAMRRERRAADLIAMPAWQDNPRVQPHVLDLYAYLTARADGKLGPGKPQPMNAKRP